MTINYTRLATLLAVGSADGLSVADAGERVVWDDTVPGLGLRLRACRRSTWIVQRRVGGRSIKRTLGPLDEMSFEEARAAARALIEAWHAPAHHGPAPRLADFVQIFLKDCAGRWKPATLRSHRFDLDKHVVPVLGAKRLDAIARTDVLAWFEDATAPTINRNRALSVLSSLMRHAEAVGWRAEGSSPCAGLRRRRTGFKARYLSDGEFGRLDQALDRLTPTNPVEVALIRFLMLTGARRSEALELDWSNVESTQAVLADSKTGPKTIWLATSVRKLLAALARSTGSPRVFAMPDGRDMRGALDRVWREVRKGAGLEGLRLHDLRHSYASVAVSGGEELRTLAALLGHAELETTMGYAHLAEAPLAAAAGRIATKLANSLTPAEPVEAIRPAPRKLPRPPPALPADDDLAAEERWWERQIHAYRKSRLRLKPFCESRGLDPAHMHQALRNHHQRAKAWRRLGR